MIRRLTIWIACMTVALLMMALALSGAAHAQAPAAPDPAGAWHGTLSTPAGDLRVGLDLTRDAAGALTGNLTSPDQTDEKIPVAKVTAAEGKLSFEVPSVLGRFAGTWNAATQAWDGTWSQGASLKLSLARGPVR
ncbi:MAG: hypothetical protein JSS35_19330 [Proteobacteria bacterium]|nr:hypothetical protein [Pseudomonadota bacterium]